MDYALLDHRHGLIANLGATAATGTAEREAGLILLAASTPAVDKAYDVASFMAGAGELRGGAAGRAHGARQGYRRPHACSVAKTRAPTVTRPVSDGTASSVDRMSCIGT